MALRLFVLLWLIAWSGAAGQEAVEGTMASALGINPRREASLLFSGFNVVDPLLAPDFYENLRLLPENESTILWSTDITTSGTASVTSSSRIYQITTGLSQYQAVQEVTWRLAEVKVFLPFSDGKTISNGRLNDAFAVLLAAYHFNNANKSSLLAEQMDLLDSCNVRLTMEVFDTELSPIVATRRFTSVLQRQFSFSQPPPAALIGAFRSAVTWPLAILTGVNGIPQVSAGSTSVDFDVKEQFPLFGRTVTNTDGEAQSALRFFQLIGATHVAILFITDSYGSSLQKGFQDAATRAGIQTESVAFSGSLVTNNSEAIPVIEALARTQFRHIYGIFSELHFEILMTTAADRGLVGPDYFYLFPDLDLFSFLRDLRVKAGTSYAKVLQGAGMIQFQGAVTENPIYSGNVEQLQGRPDYAAVSAYDKFRASWSEALYDAQFLEYVRSHLPVSLDEYSEFDRNKVDFVADPGPIQPLLYDAVTSLGLSMCKAGENTTFFTGTDIYHEFLQLQFNGASGNLTFDHTTGTRIYSTVAFVVWNSRVLQNESDGYAVVEIVPSFQFSQGEWVGIAENTFIYADGSTTAPNSLPPVDYDYNYIGNAGRIVGYIVMAITVVSSAVCTLWLVYYRDEHVVYSSQPFFLVTVCLGAIVMVSAIFPLGFEETVVSNLDGLNAACMAAPWLYVCGSAVALSALLAKIHGTYKAYKNPELDFIHVSAGDIATFLAISLFFNVSVLLTWTLLSPLHWTRIESNSKDLFDRNTTSHATCSGDNDTLFAALLAVINLLFAVLGTWWAYQARNIETEFNDSFYVGVSLAAVLQAWTMGVPIVIVSWENPQARYFVVTGIIFVTAQAIVCFVFIPKMLALRQAQKEAQDPRKAYAEFLRSRRGLEERDESESADYFESNPPMVNHVSNSLAQAIAKAEAAELAAAAADPREAENVKSDQLDALGDPAPPRRPELSRATSWSGIGRALSMRAPPSASSLRPSMPISSRATSDRNLGDPRSGIKVLHHPRLSANLALSGGAELSRAQLELFREAEERNSARNTIQAPDLVEGRDIFPVSEAQEVGRLGSTSQEQDSGDSIELNRD